MRNLTHFLHLIWNELVPKGGVVVDATCGGGHDTLKLAQLALTPTSGHLLALDIQQDALTKTKQRLEKELSSEVLNRVSLRKKDHAELDRLEPTLGAFDFVAYNLGYFPGGDKSITTGSATTIQSLKAAFERLKPGGYICATCYVGHPEGPQEQKAVDAWIQTLDPIAASIYHIEVPRKLAPLTRLIQKSKCCCDKEK